MTHKELCLATAKRFIDRVALYEYKSTSSFYEQPDVLVFGEKGTMLFEIKMSLSDFKADQYKDCRKKYRMPYWAQHINYTRSASHFIQQQMQEQAEKEKRPRVRFLLIRGKPEVELVENEHLGNLRYFVCPWGIIPIEKIPEGWGLYYYKGGKFFKKKESGNFRSDLRTENNLAVHALRRYASGDSKGILINTYLLRGDQNGTH